MKIRAHIEVEIESDEDESFAFDVAEDIAEAIQDIPGVEDAWVANVETE